MVSVVYPGVNVITRRRKDGTKRVYYYHRASGVRLPDDLTSPEFAAKYRALEATPRHRGSKAPGSFDELIAKYQASPEFLELGPKTQKDYRRYLTKIGDQWGPLSVEGVERKHVLAFRDSFAGTPRTANYVVQVLGLLFSFGIDRGYRADNPAARPRRLRTGDGHRPWEEDEIQAYRARWAPLTWERAACELLLNVGQRGGDTAKMTRAHYRQGWISAVQEKTGERIDVPASRDLIAVLDPWLASHFSLALLPVGPGGPASVDYFRHRMREAYREAGLPDDCTTHGLRYSAATRLHELGCDWETVAAITGQRTVDMVRKYTARKRRARLAIDRLNAATGNAE